MLKAHLRLGLLSFLVILLTPLFAQKNQIVSTVLQINSTEIAPNIDGVLDDEAWINQPIASGFLQTNPKPKKKPSGETEVKMIYDDQAVYISARLYDHPDSIYNFLTERDDVGNADFFTVVFNNYQDGINGDGFSVTPSGVQIDTKYSADDESVAWDAVWESATQLDDSGWTVEMRIPYSALRFPEVEKQQWGVNFGREIRRNRERSWWNFVNPAIDGLLTQTGVINGIENIEPPVRLSFFPYASAYVEHNSDDGSVSESINGGMDVKYGITDAFTLDMTLIPDFGQVRFDNQILNLSVFEVEFNENRQFFTEGVELFNKAGIFYSRRVGGRPYSTPRISSGLNKSEILTDVPAQSRLLNASKVSGRNANGLGVGVFNAVESRVSATIQDTLTGVKKKVEVNPLTNYNVLVFDQVLRKNSFVTLTNTNVAREGDAEDANVTKLDFQLANKANEYAISAAAGMSNLFSKSEVCSGYTWEAGLQKISGNFKFELSQENISDDYDPNDLGFLNINNVKNTYLFAQYAIFEPFSIFNFARHNFEIDYQRSFRKNQFMNFALSYSTVYSLQSFHAIGFNAAAEPIETNDFFETRTFEQSYNFPTNFTYGGFFSSDYSRPFALDLRTTQRVFDEQNRYNAYYEVSPRFRPNDKFFFVLEHNWGTRNNENGFVKNMNDSIIFGRRNVKEHETAITGNYIFNNRMALNLTLRHYWSAAVYDRFNRVDPADGELLPTDYAGFNEDGTTIHDISFNAFNIDLAYNWRFAPGSEISVVWKNIISEQGEVLNRDYLQEVEDLLDSPQLNNFSIKILYFIDYLDLKRKGGEKV